MEMQEADSLPGSTLTRITEENVEKVVKLIDDIAKANDQRLYATNIKYCENNLRAHLESPLFAGYYTENAAFIGKIVVSTTNPAIAIAEEWIWVSNGKDGVRVMKAFEEWAQISGASIMLINTNLGDGKTGKRIRVFENMGYKANQVSYIKWFI